MKKTMFCLLLFCSTLVQARWQDVYTITAAEIQNHRIESSERTSNFVNCDYRLKLPQNRQHQGDLYYLPTQLTDAVHFIDEFAFPLPLVVGAHAMNSNGTFNGAKPSEISLDHRDSYTLTITLGRGGATDRIVNVSVAQRSHSSPFINVIPLVSLPSYEAVFVIQRKCVANF